jgi:predicted transposase/invertase (TIGR01784 family)
MYDSLCKFLAENFSGDFATWLIGQPITFTELSPSDLSNEPIRADALILLQSEKYVLHIEFQTHPDPTIPFRMADYWIRIYRRFPDKKIIQYVIYLQPSDSKLVKVKTFKQGEMRHQFNVIRLWEQPIERFLNTPGLLPFAALSKTKDRHSALVEVANRIDEIQDRQTKSNIAASASILAALVLEKSFIQTVLRKEIMQESVIYQEIKQEGREEGRQEGRQETTRMIAINLIKNDISLEDVVKFTGLSIEQVRQLQQEISNG